MRESEASHHHALNELPGFWPAFETDHLRENWGNGLDFGYLLTSAGHVVESSGGGVEIPFPRLIQKLKGAFRVIEVTRLQPEDRALAEGDDAPLFIHSGDRQPRLDPLSHRQHFSVGYAVPRLQITLAEAEAGLPLSPLAGLVGEFGDAEVAAVGVPGASGPLAIDPKFPEIQLAVAGRRNIGGPQLLALNSHFLPAGNGASAAHHRPSAGPGSEHQAGILRC